MLSYLFNPAPGQSFKFYLPLAIFAALLIIGGLLFSHAYNKKKKHDFAFKRLFKKTGKRMVLFGIIFVLLIAFRYENIPYFAMRFWIYLNLALIAFNGYKYGKLYFKVYPRERQNAQPKSVEKVISYTTHKKRR
ncbi:hypothetical protein JKY72_07225 [Candidatus Gracilibacteria bacterium]|nr:hypothetical protein [Candidatus Gracilibacteria bacterium]